MFLLLLSAFPQERENGGIAQLARACGSYPQCRWFESDYRYQYGPMVKRLRHRPFTAVTRVRFPFGSPIFVTGARLSHCISRRNSGGCILGRIAQLVRAPASHAGGQRFESVYAHHEKTVIVIQSRSFQLNSAYAELNCLTAAKFLTELNWLRQIVTEFYLASRSEI